MKNIPFLDTLYTKHDASILLDRLETVEKSLFNVKLPFEQAVKSAFSFAAAEEFLEYVRQSGVPATAPEALRKHLDTVKSEVQNLPTATIIVASTPTTDTLKYISKWFDANIGERVLLDVTVDHTLIGGVVIEYNGKYADYSLKKLLSSRFSKKEQAMRA
jgi:F0F1-type ATP synthase delta subunit